MKIVFLNVWLCRFPDRLAGFLREHAATADVFCFQEASHDFRSLCAEILPEHELFISEKTATPAGKDSPYWYVLATAVRKNLSVLDRETLFAEEPLLGIASSVRIPFQGSHLNIGNVHGISIPGKLDNEARLRQFAIVKEHFRKLPGFSVIGGDFNVLPETESIRMFADAYRDLVSEYGIKTTRNRLAWEKHPGNELYFSDYVFADRALLVRDFSVVENEISDHLPLILQLDDSLS